MNAAVLQLADGERVDRKFDGVGRCGNDAIVMLEGRT
jgi:hypothetical protein